MNKQIHELKLEFRRDDGMSVYCCDLCGGNDDEYGYVFNSSITSFSFEFEEEGIIHVFGNDLLERIKQENIRTVTDTVIAVPKEFSTWVRKNKKLLEEL